MFNQNPFPDPLSPDHSLELLYPSQDPTLSGHYMVRTFGCQMNEHDSEKMIDILENMGLTPTQNIHNADLILFNTCSIRAKAGQKFFSELGYLHALKKRRPHIIIGVGGCLAQQEGEHIFHRAPYVDFVFGPRNIAQLPELIRKTIAGAQHQVSLSKPRQQPSFELTPRRRRSPARAYVTIMEGCDKFCAFCIVPFTRGREISRSPESILNEIRDIAAQGVPEVILLGQTVNSYRYGEVTFPRLLQTIDTIEGIRRIRFVSPHPADVTPQLIEIMRDAQHICRHIHLPLQSGSDRILKAMRRTYTRAIFLETVERLREAMPNIAISTDVIVGFPGETETDFQDTLNLITSVQFDSMFSFKYSPRPFTAAWRFGDPVPENVKTRRLMELQELQESIQREKHQTLIGTVFEVLLEGPSRKNPQELEGRTSQNHVINIPAPLEAIGTFANVQITSAGPHSLRGKLLPDIYSTNPVDVLLAGA